MPRTRYRESRILVRRICRKPKQDPVQFKADVRRLREHFERFNTDAADLCQWIMGLRKCFGDKKKDPAGFGTLGDFLLEPDRSLGLTHPQADEKQLDRLRRDVFDVVLGLRADADFAPHTPPPALLDALRHVADAPFIETDVNAFRLFERLAAYDPGHRLVVLKAAAEWIVARFRRAAENHKNLRDRFEKEKAEWEAAHPALTREIRDRFTNVYKQLRDPERHDGQTGVRKRNPRICPFNRLKLNRDNCVFGKKGHSQLCWRFDKFRQANSRLNPQTFAEVAGEYLRLRAKFDRTAAFQRLFVKYPNHRWHFPDQWNGYLKDMKCREDTLIRHARLPHCLEIGDKLWEQSTCEWNRHTELCLQYKRMVDGFPPAVLALEKEYRDWRAKYLAGPAIPAFQYPSSKRLPMPKIFGEGFYEIDFDRSILRLRLEGMAQGQWIEFGFTPWPRKYKPDRQQVRDLITSVHVHFIGNRPRVGFRFAAPHQPAPFACSQDELDDLRSKQFPRRKDDQAFLDAARARLLETYDGDADRDLRILAVDIGEKGASAVVYQGRAFQRHIALPVIKIDKPYDAMPSVLDKDRDKKPPPKFDEKKDPRGLRMPHVTRHLDRIGDQSKKMAETRKKTLGEKAPTQRDEDQRGLKRHVAWMIRDWVRHNAARIIDVAEEHRCRLILFESMRGNKPPGYDKLSVDDERKKRWMAMFSYGRIRRKVVEKAVERGMRVITLPYHMSSQHCSACGHEQTDKNRWRNNKKQRLFECECAVDPAKLKRKDPDKPRPACSCAVKLNSDENAARVLARVFWDEIKLPPPDEP